VCCGKRERQRKGGKRERGEGEGEERELFSLRILEISIILDLRANEENKESLYIIN